MNFFSKKLSLSLCVFFISNAHGENFNVNDDKISFDTLGMSDVDIELVDNEGGADAILSFNDHADWGSIVLVDVGRLDTEDIIIDSGVAVG